MSMSIVDPLLDSGRGSNRSRLFEAVSDGDLGLLRELAADASFDVSTVDDAGRCAMHFAALEGQCECVQILHELGASVDVKCSFGLSPVYFAAIRGQCECVRLLARLGASVRAVGEGSDCPLFAAAESGHENCIRLLHELGADVNGMDSSGLTAVYIAAQEGHAQCIRILHELGADLAVPMDDDSTAVYIAVQRGHMHCVRLLHELGVDVQRRHMNGASLVFRAACEGHVECIRLLHSLGVDVCSPNDDGASPLQIAAQENNAECIRVLVALGADVNASTPGIPQAIVLAAGNDCADCVRVLHELGADVNPVTGMSPVHVAAWEKSMNSLEALLEVGADIEICSAIRLPPTLHWFVSMGANVAPLLENGVHESFPDIEPSALESVKQEVESVRSQCAAFAGSTFEKGWRFAMVQLVAGMNIAGADKHELAAIATTYFVRMEAPPLSLSHPRRRRLIVLCGHVITDILDRRRTLGEAAVTATIAQLPQLWDLFLRFSCLQDLLNLRLTCRCCEQRRFPVPSAIGYMSTLEVGLIESFVGGDCAYFVPTATVKLALSS
jgi:ankyrin repeat protein